MSTPNIKSADDLIVQTEAQKLGLPIPEVSNEATKTESEQKSKAEESHNDADKKLADSQEPEEQKGSTEEATKEELTNKSSDEDSEEEVDAYGNKRDNKKLYTEEEVQRMIRERLTRGHRDPQNTTQQQQQIQEAAKDFKADPNSEETWETQLEDFITKTITKLSNKRTEENWKKQEEQKQAEFEDKFSRGLTRYDDFAVTVQGKPLTTTMMMATRNMEDPAAFIYAACKQQPQELERIAKLPDLYAQAAEIGKLEEKMRKAKLVSSTPKPSKKITGDASDEMPKHSIDQLIASHAKSKIIDRRR